MRAAIAVSFLLLFGLLSSEPARAQSAQPANPAQPAKPARHAKPAQHAAPEKTCRQQIEDLCPDTTPNTPERRACVKQGFDKLSASCQRQLGQARVPARPAAAGGLQELVEACSKDHAHMVELCQQGKAGGNGIMPCLMEHKSEFSEPCQKVIERSEAAAKEKQAAAASQGAAAKPTAAKHPTGSK